jgi:hypothetical protein
MKVRIATAITLLVFLLAPTVTQAQGIPKGVHHGAKAGQRAGHRVLGPVGGVAGGVVGGVVGGVKGALGVATADPFPITVLPPLDSVGGYKLVSSGGHFSAPLIRRRLGRNYFSSFYAELAWAHRKIGDVIEEAAQS